MKICIYGAGAFGGYLGAKLAQGGVDVSLVARGAHRQAIVDSGLRLVEGSKESTYPIRCVEDASELGAQDYVIITLKAHMVGPVARELESLYHRDTAVVSAVNGIPWWYFYKSGGPYDGHRIASVDPDDAQWCFIGPERVIGCVVYPSCEVTQPGVITHIAGERFTLGEPSGERTERITCLLYPSPSPRAATLSRIPSSA